MTLPKGPLGLDHSQDHGGSLAQLYPTTKHRHVTKATHPADHPIHRTAGEAHHRIFHCPEHDLYCVVSVEENDYEAGAENHLVLTAECWEIDEKGERTGLHATIGTHSIPHIALARDLDPVKVEDVVELMTAYMVERLCKRKKALAALDGHPIKRLAKEKQYRPPATPHGIHDTNHI